MLPPRFNEREVSHRCFSFAVLSELVEIHMNEGSFSQLIKAVESKKILFHNFFPFLCVHQTAVLDVLTENMFISTLSFYLSKH